MTAPRLEIDLGKIEDNAAILIDRLGRRGMSVTAVTKGVLGHPAIVKVLCNAGVQVFADSRIETIECMRKSMHSELKMWLIRGPQLSKIERIVRSCDASFNTEEDTLVQLSAEAKRQHRDHGVILMVEMGDFREGVSLQDLEAMARLVLTLPNLNLIGIGTNLGCFQRAVPNRTNMALLSELAKQLETKLDVKFSVISGGNSSNLNWVTSEVSRGCVNNLRLGEAILLGREAIYRNPVPGLHLDAFKLIGEVIESKCKPDLPSNAYAQRVWPQESCTTNSAGIYRTVLALGNQDCDPDGISTIDSLPILGSSSDHIVLDTLGVAFSPGTEVVFDMDYASMLRSMTSPLVEKVFKRSPRTSLHFPELLSVA